jgi:hypothetical protein
MQAVVKNSDGSVESVSIIPLKSTILIRSSLIMQPHVAVEELSFYIRIQQVADSSLEQISPIFKKICTRFLSHKENAFSTVP